MSGNWSSVIEQSARTGTAAVVSLLVARLFRLPEFYWAAITTLVILQSTLGASLRRNVRSSSVTIGIATAQNAALRPHFNYPRAPMPVYTLAVERWIAAGS